MRAASEGHANVVQLLLTAGANKEAATRVIWMIHFCVPFSFSFLVPIKTLCQIEVVI